MEVQTQMNLLLKRHQNNYINQLLLYLPASYTKIVSSNQNNYEKIISGLYKLCHQSKVDDDIDQFFKQLGIQKNSWMKLENGTQKFNFIVKNLQKCIDESIKKVNTQIDCSLSSSKKNVNSTNKENKSKDNFDWLKLKNKYPMCQPKLKAKLVQAISDSKNEMRIRDRISDPNAYQKVSLLDQSLVVDQYERIKIDYKWSDDDEKLFINSITDLKNKFNTTEFLKKCGRFRFISEHELQTLASQEISRRLDQDNKIYLSRQFLLDKYYSTRQFLTEQQMRFILKTSPLLSKCVDKNFIRNAIKNIEYEDINKLQLKIAENIISRFDQIRKAVRQSRKYYKQAKNNIIKQRIIEFEKKQEFDIIREMAREELKKYKLKKNKPAGQTKQKAMNLQNKKSFVSLNRYHPPSGLFVKDCNEQCNDDLFNHYQLEYIEKEKNYLPPSQKRGKNNMSMVQFYSGGLESRVPVISLDVINTICQLIKSQYYEKSIRQTLYNFEIPVAECGQRSNRSHISTLTKQKSCYDLDRLPKTTVKILDQSSQVQIKRKIVENKQKAKAIVYVNKLLTFAAENSYTSFKALNVKFTSDQVNTRDNKGNTALYYASKHQNIQFMNHLLNLGADPSIVCEKQTTPLHNIFKTNNLNLIIRCLCVPKAPNLNALNIENKTPLAYCTHDTLSKLYLEEAVLVVQNRRIQFNNNNLLEKGKLQKLAESLGWQTSRINSRMKLA